MVAKCSNCKFAKETNVCYDAGEFFKAYLYCFKLDDLVADDDSCDKWESDIKTVKATYEGDDTMIDIENQTCEICIHNALTEYFSTCPFFEKEEESEDCRNFAIDLGKI